MGVEAVASHPFSTCAPITAQLIRSLRKPGWSTLAGVLEHLPGPVFEDVDRSISMAHHRFFNVGLEC